MPRGRYMAAVAHLDVQPPEQVPMAELHPNDMAQVVLKRSTHYDSVPREHIIHFRRVYFSMCFEADALLGQVIDALDRSGPTARQRSYIVMISDHGEDNIEHRQTGKNNMCECSLPAAAGV
jgi:arylsulfatase A-like enzyme